MNLSKTFIEEKEIEIIDRLKNSIHDSEAYIKAASFLHFSERYDKAIEVLDIGLQQHPNNEEIIRAKFSFLSSSYHTYEAIVFAKEHSRIFENDTHSIVSQACDLMRMNLTLSPPKYLNQHQIIRLSEDIRMFIEDDQKSLKTLLTDLFDYYKLPFVGLGIAKVYADEGNDYSQNLLGTCYLKGQYIQQDVDLGMYYLNLAKDNSNEAAINRLNLFYSNIN